MAIALIARVLISDEYSYRNGAKNKRTSIEAREANAAGEEAEGSGHSVYASIMSRTGRVQ